MAGNKENWWTWDRILVLITIIVAIVACIVTVTTPELRLMVGLDHPAPTPVPTPTPTLEPTLPPLPTIPPPTASDTLANFCGYIQAGGLSQAFQDYSSQLQTQVGGFGAFQQEWRNTQYCVPTTPTSTSDNSVTTTISATRFVIGQISPLNITYNVTVTKSNNGNWLINSINRQ